MRLLITGCGRSGTLWAALALRQADIDCGHERAFNCSQFGDSDWQAESSSTAVPFLPLENTYVVHLVRNPLDVIASIRFRGGPNEVSREFHRRFSPELPSPGRVGVANWAARYWISWNRRVTGANEVIQLESVTTADVQRWARIIDSNAIVEQLPGPANQSQKRVRPVALGQLRQARVLRREAALYGYNLG